MKIEKSVLIFECSVISQVKIINSLEYEGPSVWALKKFSNFSSGWITKNVSQDWKKIVYKLLEEIIWFPHILKIILIFI